MDTNSGRQSNQQYGQQNILRDMAIRHFNKRQQQDTEPYWHCSRVEQKPSRFTRGDSHLQLPSNFIMNINNVSNSSTSRHLHNSFG